MNQTHIASMPAVFCVLLRGALEKTGLRSNMPSPGVQKEVGANAEPVELEGVLEEVQAPEDEMT